jgi:integrase
MARKKRRRARGTGYITYDKRRRQWRAVLPLPTGGSRTHYLGSASKDEAEAWLEAEHARLHAPAAPTTPTIKAALAELLADRAYVRPSTLTNYRLHARHIVAAMGDRLAVEVSAADIGRMDRAHREPTEDAPGGPMSAAVADQVLMVLDMCYRRLIALHRNVITYNPVAAHREIVTSRARGGRALREPRALDPAHCRMILRELADDPYHPIVAWLMVLGLRVGELRGLRWVNVRAGAVAIVEQRTHHDRFTAVPIKTEDTIGKGRTLPLPAQLIAITPRRVGDELVFPNARDSGSFDENTLRLRLNDAVKRARLPHTRIHDLRHTCGGGLRDLGCPYIDEILGHKPRTQTAHYARARVEALRPWIEQWAGVVLGSAAQKLSSNVL